MKGSGESDVFIDGMHFQHVMEQLKVKDVDLEKFSDKLSNGKKGQDLFL